MAYSYIRYTGNGSTTNYTFNFPYLDQAHIKVRLNGTLTTLFTFLNASTIQLTSAPASGVVIEIRRETPKDNPIVNFTDGSVLLERDLDLLVTYDLYLAQETADVAGAVISQDSLGVWQAQNKRIANVADPVSAQDAVTKNYFDSVYTPQLDAKVTAAAGSATNAANSATASAASAATASTQASNASTSATNAANSATAAAASASSASSSAGTATTQANTATTQAGNAASSASAAATSASNSATSATSAANSASSASTSATNAATSATNAGNSAVSAGNSATSAAASASTATTQASNASASAANTAALLASFRSVFLGAFASDAAAVTFAGANSISIVAGIMYENTTVNKFRIYSGTAWGDYDSSAQASQSAAALSAANAASSASTASTQATNAANSATSAATQATNAANSATAAASSATSASNSASTATSQASAASTSASNAATSATNAATSATNAANSYNTFHNQYQGAYATAPTTRPDSSALQIGDLYFNTTTNSMQVRGSSGWTNAGSSVNGTARRYRYIATAGQTTFTGSDSNGNTMAYDAGYIDVYLNGIRLDQSDYTASSGTSLVLASGAAVNDELNIIAFGTFSVANFDGSGLVNGTVSANKLASGVAVSNLGYTPVNKAGDTMTGRLFVGSGSDAPIQFSANSNGAVPPDTFGGGLGYNHSGGGCEVDVWNLYTGASGSLGGFTFKKRTGTSTFTEFMKIDGAGRVTMPYQPAFYAMMNNTILTSTAAIVFEDVYVNRGGHYNSSNGRFTAPIAGTYCFSANFLKRGGAGRLLFNKNDVYYGSGASQVYQGTTSEIPMAATIIITLAAGDYVTVIASIDAGDVYGNANSHNGFSGFLLG